MIAAANLTGPVDATRARLDALFRDHDRAVLAEKPDAPQSKERRL